MNLISQYLVDCAAESGALTPLEATLYDNSTELGQILDLTVAAQPNFSLDEVAQLARSVIARLSDLERNALTLAAIPHVSRLYSRLVERACAVFQHKLTKDLDLDSGFNLERVLGLSKASTPTIFSSMKDVSPNSVESVLAQYLQPLVNRWLADFKAIQTLLNYVSNTTAGQRDELRRTLTSLNHSTRTESKDDAFKSLLHDFEKNSRKALKTAKGAIKRGLRLFERTHQMDTVKALINEQEVEISHPNSPLKFVITSFSSKWLVSGTLHVQATAPFGLAIYTKSNVHLANLCVYVKQTPILDQLFSLMLFIQSGNEDEILKVANFFSVQDPIKLEEVFSQKGLSLACSGSERAIQDSNASFSAMITNAPLHKADEIWQPISGPVTEWVKAMLIPINLQPLLAIKRV